MMKVLALLCAVVAMLNGCGLAPSGSLGTPPPEATALPGSLEPSQSVPLPIVLLAAGDIADCALETDTLTADLLAEEDGAIVAALGDLVYPSGSAERYATCFAETWGHFPDRIFPAVGNHDLAEDGGRAYWALFGERAGVPGDGWYSYDAGSWHVVVLNSNCDRVSCRVGSSQHAWLVADLAASKAECTVAYWHHPRFSSGPHGDAASVSPFWEALDAAGAELVLAGHDHHYERMTALDPEGAPTADGMRQFVVGTGGARLREVVRARLGSEAIIDDRHGVLRLQLGTDGYRWEFLTVDGRVADEGADSCRS